MFSLGSSEVNSARLQRYMKQWDIDTYTHIREANLNSDSDLLSQDYLNLLNGRAYPKQNWDLGDLAILIQDSLEKNQETSLLTNRLGGTSIRKRFAQFHRISMRFTKASGIRDLPGLSWTHYRDLAGKPNAEQLLRVASTKGLSKRNLDTLPNYTPAASSRTRGGGSCQTCKKSASGIKLRVPPREEEYKFCSLTCLQAFVTDLLKQEESALTNEERARLAKQQDEEEMEWFAKQEEADFAADLLEKQERARLEEEDELLRDV